ncbi:MAG: hypothetical protein WCZ90_09515 [Melioribacteraceae bacterium]
MFENPYAFIRWIAILSGIALLIYRFELLKVFMDLFTGKKNGNDEIQNKVDELLNKRRKK